MLTQEKPDETGTTFETCPSKLLVQLAQQTGVSTPAAQNATKLNICVQTRQLYFINSMTIDCENITEFCELEPCGTYNVEKRTHKHFL